MNCEQVRELEAAFALDALDEGEREAVAAHLRSCGEHRALAEYRAVAILLASEGSEVNPPVRLRGRVLAAAAPRAIHHWWASRGWYAAAAVLAVACLAGAAWAMTARDSGDEDAAYVRDFTAGGVAVHVEADFEAGNAQVAFRGLAAGEEYHLWAIRGEDWLSMGRFKANPEGNWSGEFAFAIASGDALCLTRPTPEQPADPFGDPLFIETL